MVNLGKAKDNDKLFLLLAVMNRIRPLRNEDNFILAFMNKTNYKTYQVFGTLSKPSNFIKH